MWSLFLSYATEQLPTEVAQYLLGHDFPSSKHVLAEKAIPRMSSLRLAAADGGVAAKPARADAAVVVEPKLMLRGRGLLVPPPLPPLY